jgi:sulfoquinovosidase
LRETSGFDSFGFRPAFFLAPLRRVTELVLARTGYDRGVRWFVLFAATLGCGESFSGAVGAFDVQSGEGTAFEIAHSSGLEIAARAFAFRKSDATYEMQFGSFRIEEEVETHWVSGARLGKVDRDGEKVSATIFDERGEELGELSVVEERGSLRVTASALGEQNRARVSFGCDDGGGFLGFGAQTADVDHRGQVVPVFVSEQGIGKVETDEPHEVWFLVGTRHQSYLAVPSMVAPRAVSYGVMATTLHRSIWDLCASDPNVLSIEVWEGTAEILISPGPSPLDVIARQTAHTGRIPTPPSWTFGVWMEAIGGTAAVRAEVDRLRAEHVPVSAIWSEDWRGARVEGDQYVLEEDWGWDQALYPELPALIGELHARGIAFMSYFNTFLVEDADVFDDAAEYFVKDRRGDPFLFREADGRSSGLADLFADDARAFVRGHLEDALAMGADGWMADFAEWYPADRRQVEVSDGGDAESAHHRYPVAWAEVNREAVANMNRDDVVIFHRSGYTGSQGLAHVIWAGDQRTSFDADDGLPTVIPIMLGLSATGFPVVTHDIGGYVSATNDNTTKELFFRWTSLGAFSPVMRTHHGRDAALNWRWSSDPETIAHFKRWADFHTALFPYFEGLAKDSVERGAPILRPLAFSDPADVRLHGIKDAFTVGEHLLVAPIVTSSTTKRRVLLPNGTWYSLASGEAVSGEIEIDVPLGELGLFARAGAVIPTLPAGIESLRATDDVLDLDDQPERAIWIWLGANGSARLGEGRIALESSAIPSGEITIAEGELIERADRSRTLRGPSIVLEADGVQHRITAENIDPSSLTYLVRW